MMAAGGFAMKSPKLEVGDVDYWLFSPTNRVTGLEANYG